MILLDHQEIITANWWWHHFGYWVILAYGATTFKLFIEWAYLSKKLSKNKKKFKLWPLMIWEILKH